jgi:glycosyltransferase involved in cell wall biosynthesis
MSQITAVVLTFNEEIHLERCLHSISKLTDRIVVVDSFSTDSTISIAEQFNATILQKVWENNHALQFNWALDQLRLEPTDWILRIDADEILTDELISEIRQKVPLLSSNIHGVNFGRKITFQRKLIRFGGVGKNIVSRLFRYGYGRSQSHWMDEHIKVSGDIVTFKGSIIDDNLNNLTWWTAKHNNYASREAVELLIIQFLELRKDEGGVAENRGSLRPKRWIKEVVYSKLPFGVRAFCYFFYRYFFLLGFLDGSKGFEFHFLQGFWYRYLVDAKVIEVIECAKRESISVKDAIKRVLGITL